MRIVTIDNDKVNLVFTTDWHLSETPPGRRTGSYAEDILGKIKFVGELAHKVGGVSICGGDVFHSKSSRSYGNTFHLVRSLMGELMVHPHNKVYGVHGNHDVWQDRTDSLPFQPFGVLTQAGVFEDLSVESVLFENAHGNENIRVQVDAFPYADDMVTLDRVMNAPPRQRGVQYRVILMHQYGNPGNQGSMFGHPTIGYNQMIGCDYDLALWGHDHSRAETVTVGTTTHIRLGSLSRASLAMDEVDRPVAAAVISFRKDKVAFKEVPIPVKPLEIAFVAANNDVERVQQTERVVGFLKGMDVAVGTIESTDPQSVMRQLCPIEESKIYDMAADRCGF